MSGFFLVTDIPSRRIVQYKRVTHPGDNTAYIEDESVLGKAVDLMPYADKTGIAVASAGTLYEVPYLPDAGAVYISKQPVDSIAGDTLTAEAKAGVSPYYFQWYKDSKQVVNVPSTAGKLVAADAGEYFCVVTDSTGAQAVSVAAKVTTSDSE